MGFSGGGSNVLKSHRHDGTVIEDGGSLDFQNITQSNMSSGSVTYSDGSHLQELTIGAAGEILTVSGANIPSWVSSSTGGIWTSVAEADLSGGASDTLECTGMTTYDTYFVQAFLEASGSLTPLVNVNGDSGNVYSYGLLNNGTSVTETNITSLVNLFGGSPTAADLTVNMFFNNRIATQYKHAFFQCFEPAAICIQGSAVYQDAVDLIDQITFTNVSTGDFGTASRMVVYGCNWDGS